MLFFFSKLSLRNFLKNYIRFDFSLLTLEFNLSRGHKIERRNYLDSLYGLTKAPKDANSSESKYKPLIAAPSKEPISWRAPQEPKLPPSPREFDSRDRFERVRQEANMQRQQYTSAANAAAARPARQFLDNSFVNSPRNNRNYSSRYVNTSSNLSKGNLQLE